MRDGVLREHTGGLDVNRIVQQVERLQRRVRGAAIHRAFFTRGRIEVQQAGMEIRALPRRVQAAPVQIRAVARGVLALGKIERPKIPGWLNRADAGTAKALGQQTGQLQRDIAHVLRVHAEAVLMREQAVFRIDVAGGRGDRRLSIGLARDDQPNDVPHIPVMGRRAGLWSRATS